MALHDEGIRFTEKIYATKEDVKSELNFSMIDTIWDKIMAYRSNFYADTNLINIDNHPFSLTLYVDLQKRLSTIERKIFQTYVNYQKKSNEFKQEFKERLTLQFFDELTYSNTEKFSQEMLLHVIRRDISVFPVDLAPLGFYQSALSYFETHIAPLNCETLSQINLLVGGEQINSTINYRKEELETSHYYQNNYIYKASPIEEIPTLMENLFEFLNNDEFSPLLKSIIACFYIDYVKPFEYQNEETAAVLSKLILSKGYDEAGFFILTEGLAFDRSENSKKVKKTVQETLDLTYYVVHYLELLENNLLSLNELINELQATFVEEERYLPEDSTENNEELHTNIDENNEPIPLSPVVRNFTHIQPLQTELPQRLVGQSEVALPIFPSGIEKNAIESIVENLLEVYPYLKRTQAHFYASHCTIGKHYTIAQFKKEESVAYETARTSMDFLAEQGFYKKSQIRNKFVYTPIPRR